MREKWRRDNVKVAKAGGGEHAPRLSRRALSLAAAAEFCFAFFPLGFFDCPSRLLVFSPILCAELASDPLDGWPVKAAHLDRRQAKFTHIGICRRGSHLDGLDLTEATFSSDATPWEIWRA